MDKPRLGYRLAALRGTFVPLLAALILVTMGAPFAADSPARSIVLVTLVLVAGVLAIHQGTLVRALMVGALPIALGVRSLAVFYGDENRWLFMLAHLGIAAYMLALAVLSIEVVLHRQKVSRDTVLGAICGYLLFGHVFAFMYAAVNDVAPGSFNTGTTAVDGVGIGHGTFEFLYFSFVTLSTVGYGDILAASPTARSLVMCEMVLGQMYIAAFMARLVGALGTEVKVAGSDGSSTE